MAKSGDIVVYRRDVCRVKDLIKKYRNDEDYYVLLPLNDETLTVYVSVENAAKLFRPVISREEAEELISKIPSIEPVEVGDRMIENVYRDLIHSNEHEDLVRVIKTAYLRSEEKLQKGLRRSEKDKTYFRMAEKILYSELSVCLEKTYNETEEYVVSQVRLLNAAK
ncbi:hypothetical protein B7Y94_00960 [Candidatus Saccharibacteria bacterium 32-49-12]|nr:MAG: hypothetical protein B7Y94_00960 [Candidatus Saccharibacteria bacterium 32-49-12]